MAKCRVEQVRVSGSVAFFANLFTSCFGLQQVTDDTIDREKPCLFVGAYNDTDKIAIASHRAPALVLWCGADLANVRTPEMLVKLPGVIQLPNGLQLTHVMDRFTKTARSLRFPFTDWRKWPLCPLGDKIYAYAPNDNYGLNIVKQIWDKTGFEILLTTSAKTLNYEHLLEAYKQSFIGLRPRMALDGIAATVQEMGLMGRRSIWNGGTPSSLPWGSIDDILRLIDRESKYIGQTREFVRQATLEYLELDDEWLYVEV